MALRESDDEIFNNIYFTPDLAKSQRVEAFKLREERRYRMNELHETNLEISRGQIVKVPKKVESSDADGQGIAGPSAGGT